MTAECWHRYSATVTEDVIQPVVAKVCRYCGRKLTFKFWKRIPEYARRWLDDEDSPGVPS